MSGCEALCTKAMRQPCLCVQSNATRGGATVLNTLLLKVSSSGYSSPLKDTFRCPHLRCSCTCSPRDSALEDTWRHPCLMYPHPRCPRTTSPTESLPEDSSPGDSLLKDILRFPHLRHTPLSHPRLASLRGTLCLMTPHSRTP